MIAPIGPKSFSPTARAGIAAGSAFRMPAGDAAPQAAALATPERIGASGLAGLLALQEYHPGERRRRALRHGQSMLARLSSLQQAILSGATDEAGLNELAQLAQEPIDADDPHLQMLLGAVQLRARVELAKRGHMVTEGPL